MPWHKSRSRTYRRRRHNSHAWRELTQATVAVLYLVICPILGMASLTQGRTGLAAGYAAVSIFAYIVAFVSLFVESTRPDRTPVATRA